MSKLTVSFFYSISKHNDSSNSDHDTTKFFSSVPCLLLLLLLFIIIIVITINCAVPILNVPVYVDKVFGQTFFIAYLSITKLKHIQRHTNTLHYITYQTHKYTDSQNRPVWDGRIA